MAKSSAMFTLGEGEQVAFEMNISTMAGQAGMLSCERRLHDLCVDAQQRPYHAALEKLCERARFANKREVPECDAEIAAQLAGLERLVESGGEKEKVIPAINALDGLFRKRGQIQQQSNRGGF